LFTKPQTHSAIAAHQTHPYEPNQNTLIQFSADPQSSLPVQTLWYLINTAHWTEHTHTCYSDYPMSRKQKRELLYSAWSDF